jgi:hypothetical protein
MVLDHFMTKQTVLEMVKLRHIIGMLCHEMIKPRHIIGVFCHEMVNPQT